MKRIMSSNAKTSSKRKRLGEKEDEGALVKARKTNLKVINLEKTSVSPDRHFQYRAGKPYGESAPAGARGHTPGHLVYYPGGEESAFVGVRFLIGKAGALCHAVYTDSVASQKYTIVLGVSDYASEYIKTLLSSLSNKPKGVSADKLFMQNGVKVKTSSATSIVNRDSDAQDTDVKLQDLAGSTLQLVTTLRFNTTPLGKTSVSLLARSIVILKMGEPRLAAESEDHDELVSMAI